MDNQKLSKKERKALKKQQANATVDAALATMEADNPAEVTPVQQMLALPEAESAIVIVPPAPQQKAKRLADEVALPEYIDPSNYVTDALYYELTNYGATPEQLDYLIFGYNNMITVINDLRTINYQAALYIVKLEDEFAVEEVTRVSVQQKLAAKDKEIARLKTEYANLEKAHKDFVDQTINGMRQYNWIGKLQRAVKTLKRVALIGTGIAALVALSSAITALAMSMR